MEVAIRKVGDEWAAIASDRQIGKSKCRNCIIKVMLAVTKKSERYKTIAVYNEDGSLQVTLPTGIQ